MVDRGILLCIIEIHPLFKILSLCFGIVILQLCAFFFPAEIFWLNEGSTCSAKLDLLVSFMIYFSEISNRRDFVLVNIVSQQIVLIYGLISPKMNLCYPVLGHSISIKLANGSSWNFQHLKVSQVCL